MARPKWSPVNTVRFTQSTIKDMSDFINQIECVCKYCFEEDALNEFINAHAEYTHCSFCDETDDEPISVLVSELMAYMLECIQTEYDDAANWLSYESREGGYQGVTYNGFDLVVEIFEIGFPRDTKDKLFGRIVNGLSDQVWCENDPYGLNPKQIVEYSWADFCRIVKHERRYFFGSIAQDSADPESLAPADLLDRILRYALQLKLVKELSVGSSLYRARAHGDHGSWRMPGDLGPPPVEKATQSNRMSPAGIVMFYGSDNLETALKETATRDGMFSVGEFQTTRKLHVLDLSTLPPKPSIFEAVPESAEVYPRRAWDFLSHVGDEISKPILRDNQTHIEYVPTQVVTEFIRMQRSAKQPMFDGIRYSSASNKGFCSYVLFATQDNVVGCGNGKGNDSWLELVDVNYFEVINEPLSP